MMHPQANQTEENCSQLSETYGAMSYDAFGTACWRVWGKAVQLGPSVNSIEEGFKIVNFNFNATGKVKPASNVTKVPGPKQGLGIYNPKV